MCPVPVRVVVYRLDPALSRNRDEFNDESEPAQRRILSTLQRGQQIVCDCQIYATNICAILLQGSVKKKWLRVIRIRPEDAMPMSQHGKPCEL